MSQFAIRIFAGIYSLAGVAAFAQPAEIPKDLLDLDHLRCMNSCVPSFGQTTCKPLCDCTVDEFKKRLDFDKYLTLSVQMSRSEITPENQTLLNNIGQLCAAELDRKNIEIGGPAQKEKPAEKPQPVKPE